MDRLFSLKVSKLYGNCKDRRRKMKRKVVGILLATMAVCAMTACGGNNGEDATSQDDKAVVSESNSEEDGGVEVSDEVKQALQDAQNESQENTSIGVVKTVQGTFAGYYDDNSIGVTVNGTEVEYTLGNDKVKEKVATYSEGDSMMFEAEVDTNKITNIVESVVVEPPTVTLTDEEAASGIEVGQLIALASENVMTVKIGEEQYDYQLSEEAMKDIYDAKVNYGYDVKFQTEGEGDNKKIVKFIYDN